MYIPSPLAICFRLRPASGRASSQFIKLSVKTTGSKFITGLDGRYFAKIARARLAIDSTLNRTAGSVTVD